MTNFCNYLQNNLFIFILTGLKKYTTFFDYDVILG